jgi:LuxR family transcriptional regulator, quorum-sensing system regulator BjaR1
MMIVSSSASSTRRNAGSEAVKVLKTHLPKVINELLSKPTVDDVLDHMQRDLREIGVEDFGIFRFTYEGLPLEKWLLGARVEKGTVARHVYKGELQASPVFRHCKEALEPFFWYDTPHEPGDAERFKRARKDGVPEALVVPVPGPKGAIGVGWFGSATNSRSELHKHRFTIQVICIAGFYRLKDLVAPAEEPTQSRLSKREREILVGVAKGMSSEEIGDMLHLSDRTVDWHIEQAMKRLDAKNRVQAVVLAMQKSALTI